MKKSSNETTTDYSQVLYAYKIILLKTNSVNIKKCNLNAVVYA